MLEIDEPSVKAPYFQHPAFGFHLMTLRVGRLSADVARARARSAPSSDEALGASDGAAPGSA